MRNKTLLWVWFWVETLSYPYLCTESLSFSGSPLAPQINLHFGDRATLSKGQDITSRISIDWKHFVPSFPKKGSFLCPDFQREFRATFSANLPEEWTSHSLLRP